MRPKAWQIGLAVSVAAHVVIASVAAVVVLRATGTTSAGGSSAAGGASSSGGGASSRGPAGPTIRPTEARDVDVRKSLAGERRRAERLSNDEKLAKLREKSERLKEMNPKAVGAAASLVEKIAGANTGRAVAPREGVKGEFHAGSAVPHDIRRKTVNGRTVYEYTLVDKEGRSVTCDIDDSQMTDADRAAFQVFQMSRGNAALRRLVDAAIRIGDSELPPPAPASRPTTARAR